MQPKLAFLFVTIFLALSISDARACSTCNEHKQPQAKQDTGSSVTMDDSAPRRGFAAAKPADDGTRNFRMRADGTVEITKTSSRGMKSSRPSEFANRTSNPF